VYSEDIQCEFDHCDHYCDPTPLLHFIIPHFSEGNSSFKMVLNVPHSNAAIVHVLIPQKTASLADHVEGFYLKGELGKY
jgi:hypothetical protein